MEPDIPVMGWEYSVKNPNLALRLGFDCPDLEQSLFFFSLIPGVGITLHNRLCGHCSELVVFEHLSHWLGYV